MGRVLVHLGLIAAGLVSSPGCSLILDFSDKAGVHDASIDGPYTADECAYKEPNDTFDTAAMVLVGDTGPAAICKTDGDAGLVEDDDYYRFSVPQGTTKVTISATFTVRDVGDLDLKLVDTNNIMLAQSRGFTDTETITCPSISPACAMLAPGDYIFEVFPAVPSNVNNYTFSVTLE